MMSKVHEDSEPKSKKPKIDTEKKKQVKFGFVETKYYQRSIGCVTNEPGIKLGASYYPFATTKTHFDEHDPCTCCDCITKKNKENNKSFDHVKDNNPKKLINEKKNEFYNIHGLTIHTAPCYNGKERIKILFESGIRVMEIKKSLVEQQKHLKIIKKLNEFNNIHGFKTFKKKQHK